jgi:hypothetical protein
LVSLVGREVPIYPEAKNVEVHQQAEAHWGTLSYLVPGLLYPSRDVADFYDEWALHHGWVTDRTATRDWHDFVDATQPGKPLVSQLLSTWRDSKSRERLVLGCQYRSWQHEGGGYPRDFAGDQIVSLGIYPAESIR